MLVLCLREMNKIKFQNLVECSKTKTQKHHTSPQKIRYLWKESKRERSTKRERGGGSISAKIFGKKKKNKKKERVKTIWGMPFEKGVWGAAEPDFVFVAGFKY
jgi:hypothetical protein